MPRTRIKRAIPQPNVAKQVGEQKALLDCSVVIPTFRRDENLARLLEALAAQDLAAGSFEIIVVDDACSASTPGVIAAVVSRHPKLCLSLLPGRSAGPASARNLGWRSARGRVIAFIDDDAYPANSSWLREGLAALDLHDAAGVSGRVVVPVDQPPTDFQRNVKRLEQGTFLTCNAFYRRDWLERVDGFDEQFAAPYREDSDLQFRVEAAGGSLVTYDGATVIHPAPPGRFAVSLRLQRYSLYNALLYKKHPRRFRDELERQPPLHYYAILAAAGTALIALFRRRPRGALLALLPWLLLEGRFFLKRASGASHQPRHLVDLALTSLLIPPLSIYWRIRGAIRFRVIFF